jgi:plasmid stabilization system protein ParE
MADTYRVITTDRAFADLDEVLSYISRRSPQGAGRMIDRLLLAVERLDFMPRRFAVVDVDPTTGHEIRKWSCGPTS